MDTTTEQGNVIRVTCRAYTKPGGCMTQVLAYVHTNCPCRIASTLVGTFDNLADAEKLAAEKMRGSHRSFRHCTKSTPLREQAQPADTTAEQVEVSEGTWHGAWITADADTGQQLTLDGTRPDAQQGALFA